MLQGGGPVVIRASINLRNILDVAEKEQIISLETTLRLYWRVSLCDGCIYTIVYASFLIEMSTVCV